MGGGATFFDNLVEVRRVDDDSEGARDVPMARG
jgi:hypothetical protein